MLDFPQFPSQNANDIQRLLDPIFQKLIHIILDGSAALANTRNVSGAVYVVAIPVFFNKCVPVDLIAIQCIKLHYKALHQLYFSNAFSKAVLTFSRRR